MKRIFLGAVLGVLAGCSPAPTANAPPTSVEKAYSDLTPAEKLKEEVGTAAVPSRVVTQAEAAAAAAFTEPTGVQFEGVKGFDFMGEPTVCGYVRARGGASRQRFIWRNSNAVVEKDVQAGTMDMMWQVCQTVGFS